MRCKSSPRSGIGFLVLVLSLGLAGCPAGSEGTPVEAGPTGADPIAKTTQALQSTPPAGQAVAGPTTAAPGSKAAQALQSAFPSGRLSVVGRGASRFYGPSLSKGATPAASVEAFRNAYATSLGITASDLVPQELKKGLSVASSAPQGSGLMYDLATGQPRFWLYRAGQTLNGVKVYHAQLLTLVRNVAGYPVVWSSSSLRNLSSLVVSAGIQARAPDRDKSLRSIRRGPNDFVGRPLPPPQSITSLSTPELVVFAGTEDREVEPRMAIEYTATTAPDGRWHFVADASTGDVLIVESLDLFASITGKVTGNVTQGNAAMECNPALPTDFPYAEVTGPQPATAFAGMDGSYTLDGDFSGTVNVSSPMRGMHFSVTNFAGSPDDLTDTVVPPATTADFLHNADGTDHTVLAQSNAYVQLEQARAFLLKYLPNYPTIPTQTGFEVHVNLSTADWKECSGNAHYFASVIETCRADGFFTNMAFGDILHHEYGHHIVAMGNGGEQEYSEGMGDTIAALYSGRSGLGIGRYFNDCATPDRDAANKCQYDPNFCSTCGNYDDAHGCGMLLSGTIWDIRKNLQVTEPYYFESIINHLTLSSIQKHTGHAINSQIAIDLITLDDDDGDYTNGSPHSTEICTGFAAHGMTCPPFLTGLGVSPPTAFSAQGPFGGPSAPSSMTYTVENFGPDASIQYQVTAPPAATWLTITNGSGSVAIGQVAHVTVALSSIPDVGKGEYDAVLQFTNLTNGVGNQTRAAHLAIGLEAIFSETFTRGLGSFSLGSEPTNLWHASNGCGSSLPEHSLMTSLYFGLDSSCNCDNGQIVAGTATSGSVTINNTSLAKLLFNYFLVTEHNTYYDHASVQLSVNGGPFTVVASNNQNQGGVVLTDGGSGWEPAEVDLTPYLAGFSSATVQVRFAFDSVDALFNTNTGFLVDDVQIMALNNQPPVVNAGLNRTITLPGTTLWGFAWDDGLPNPPAKLTTTWSKVSGPGTVTFADPNVPQTTATFSTSGTYVLQLTGTDSVLTTSPTCTLTVDPAPNTAPTVDAGPDQTVLLSPATNLAGTVNDDGLPDPPKKVTISWTKVSGPGTVTFANSKVAATTATFSKTGTYVLRLTGNDSALSTSDDVTVTVTTNQKPSVNAGPDQTIGLSETASLAGTASDDGFPKPPSLTTTWSKTSGPGTVTFANKNALSTTATFSAAGTYVLRLTASDGALSAWDEVTIAVSTPCAGLCSNPTKFTINKTYQSGDLGTNAVCRETTSVVNGGTCGNFLSPRVLKVNGTTEACDWNNWTSVPAKRNGGYCIQATSGKYSYAAFTVW